MEKKSYRKDRERDYEQDMEQDFMGGDDRDGRKIIGGGHARKKACRFCTDSEFVLDYKNTRVISQFLTEHGKIVPSRISGACANHQRKLTTAVKIARTLGLVGYVSVGAHY